jgi:hypothetical protein
MIRKTKLTNWLFEKFTSKIEDNLIIEPALQTTIRVSYKWNANQN